MTSIEKNILHTLLSEDLWLCGHGYIVDPSHGLERVKKSLCPTGKLGNTVSWPFSKTEERVVEKLIDDGLIKSVPDPYYDLLTAYALTEAGIESVKKTYPKFDTRFSDAVKASKNHSAYNNALEAAEKISDAEKEFLILVEEFEKKHNVRVVNAKVTVF